MPPPAPSSRKNGAAKSDASALRTPMERQAMHVPGRAVKAVRALRGITLIPAELQEGGSLHWPRRVLITSLGFALLLIVIPAVALQVMIRSERTRVDEAEARRATMEQRVAMEAGELDAYRSTIRRAAAVQGILTAHRSWAPFFDLLEHQTLPYVRYQQLTADATGSVLLPATATDMRTAAAQLIAWRLDPRVRTVESSGFAAAGDELGIIQGARFDLRLQLDAAVFSARAARTMQKPDGPEAGVAVPTP